MGGRLHCGNPGRIDPEGMVWCAPVTAFGAERLTNPARPRRVVVVDPIPRTATGTIRKAELRGAT